MIRVRLLGAFDIRAADGTSIHALPALPKPVAVFSYLLLARPRGYWRRDSLVALFWPEYDAEHARASLRGTLHRLRATLGGSVLASRGREEVGVAPGAVWCDVHEFEACTDAGDDERALRHYAGHLLDGFHVPGVSAEFEHWLDAERARVRNVAAGAAARLAEKARVARDLAGAEHWYRRALSISASDETAVRNLVEVLAAQGKRAEAVHIHAGFAARLKDEFGLEVSGATASLLERVRAAGPPPSSHGAAPETPADAVVATHRAPSRVRRWSWGVVGMALLAVLALVTWRGTDDRERAEVRVAPAQNVPSLQLVGDAVPLGREQNSAIMDEKHASMIVFGGRQATRIFDDVWKLDLPRDGGAGSWAAVPVERPGPAPRWGHAAVYDTVTDAMVVFGGAFGQSAPCTNETWVLNNASGHRGQPHWQKLEIAGASPASRANHTASYDARSGRLFVFGGHDCFAPRFGDVWILEHANGRHGAPLWRRVNADAPAGPPPARSNHIAGYDAAADVLLVYGGVTSDGELLNDGWALEHASGATGRPTWRHLEIMGSPRRALYAGAYDAQHHRVLAFGALSRTHNGAAELWSLDFPGGLRGAGRWRRLASYPAVAAPDATSPAVYAPSAGLLLLFGGTQPGSARYDTWAFNVARR